MRTYITLLLAIISLHAIGQSCRISGTVTTDKKAPLIAALVYINGEKYLTDANGKYAVTLTKGIYNFSCAHSGFKKKELINVHCDGEVKVVDFQLVPVTISTDSIVTITEELESAPKGDAAATFYNISPAPSKDASMTYYKSEKKSTTYCPKFGGAAATKSESYHWSSGSDKTMHEYEFAAPAARAGTLTSGEVNDFSKWKMWSDLGKGEFENHSAHWGFYPSHRYMTEVTNDAGFPVCGATVTLIDGKGTEVWKAKSDNTGKAELWAFMFDNKVVERSTPYSIKVQYHDQEKTIRKASEFSNGANRVILHTDCGASDVVDIVFTVDATGSMGDEINYLKTELLDVIRKAQKNNHDLSYKLGSVFYRDHGDEYLTKYSQLDADINKACNFISQQSAGGGGDFPEAVDEALKVTINDIKWDENARAKIVFLILDAPPHDDNATKQRLDALIKKAAEKGVRIVPLACSGVDKSTEYILRSFALATNGTYTFLTDHSGVGGSHIAPSTDKYKVEHMNDLILRLILQYSYYPDCKKYNKEKQKELLNKIDTNFTIMDSAQHQRTDVLDEPLNENEFADSVKIYPNPTSGPLTIEIKGDVTELFLTDISGKVLERYQTSKGDKRDINISDNAAGIYFLRYFKNDHWKAGKIVLLKN